MNAATHTCTDCAAALPPEYPGSVCAGCLWKAMDAEEEIGALFTVPGHTVECELARGGMGIVYRAREDISGREVALKMLPGQWCGSAEMRERFRLEGRAAAALDHPAILPVYQIGEHDSAPYFTMKLAPGGTLAARRAAYAGKYRDIAELIARLADALGYAHRRGMLHRDIKPGNVLFDAEGQPYLADFGLAKLTDEDSGLTVSSAMLGTPHYLAPEIVSADARAASTASDVWSMGVMLWELLAGRQPFEAAGFAAVLRRIASEPVPSLPPEVPRDLAAIAMMGLEKEPARRYAGAAELAADLRRWLTGHPVLARRPGRLARTWAWARRNPVVAGLSLLSVVALAGAVAALWRENVNTRRALSESMLANARVTIQSQQPGWRAAALESLSEAAALKPDDPAVAAAAVLALTGSELEPAGRIPHPGPSAVISPGGQFMATRTEHELVIGRADQTVLRRLPVAATKNYRSGPFSPLSKWLVVRDDVDGTRLVPVQGDGAPVQVSARLTGTAVFDAQDRWFAAGYSADCAVVVDLTASPPQVITLPEATRGYFPMALAPDGKHLAASTGNGRKGAGVFRLPSGEKLYDAAGLDGEYAYSLAWPGDGRYLYAGLDLGQVYRIEAAPGGAAEVIARCGGRVEELTPIGTQWLAAVPIGGYSIPLINLHSLTVDFELPPGLRVTAAPRAMQFSYQRQKATEWESFTLHPSKVCARFTLPAPLGPRQKNEGTLCCAISGDGKLAAASEGVGISVFDPASPASVRRISDWRCLALAVDGTRGLLGVGTTDKTLIFPTLTPEPAARLLQFHPGLGRSISFADQCGFTLAANGRGEIRLTDKNGKDLPLPSALAGVPVYYARLNAEGTALAAVHSTRKELMVFSLPGGELTGSRPTQWQGPRFAFAGGDRIIIGDRDGYECWDFRAKRTLWTRSHQIVENRPRLVATAPAAGIAALTPDYRSIELVSIDTGAPILPPLALPRPLLPGDLAMDAAGNRVIAISPGGEMQVWDVAALRQEMERLLRR